MTKKGFPSASDPVNLIKTPVFFPTRSGKYTGKIRGSYRENYREFQDVPRYRKILPGNPGHLRTLAGKPGKIKSRRGFRDSPVGYGDKGATCHSYRIW